MYPDKKLALLRQFYPGTQRKFPESKMFSAPANARHPKYVWAAGPQVLHRYPGHSPAAGDRLSRDRLLLFGSLRIFCSLCASRSGNCEGTEQLPLSNNYLLDGQVSFGFGDVFDVF